MCVCGGGDRSVIHRGHRVSIVEMTVVRIGPGWGNTGASQIKTRAANRKQGWKDKTSACEFGHITSALFFSCDLKLLSSSSVIQFSRFHASSCDYKQVTKSAKWDSPEAGSRHWYLASAGVTRRFKLFQQQRHVPIVSMVPEEASEFNALLDFQKMLAVQQHHDNLCTVNVHLPACLWEC